MKKLIVVCVLLALMLSLAACGEPKSPNEDVPAEEDNNVQVEEPAENTEPEAEQSEETEILDDDGNIIPIRIEELEITTDIVDGKPVFWAKNNSEFTLTGIKYKRTISGTDSIIDAYAWSTDIGAGDTSEVATFTTENQDENGEYIAATEEEFENSYDLTIEFNYHNEDRSVDAWLEYNFITDSYRGFSYI